MRPVLIVLSTLFSTLCIAQPAPAPFSWTTRVASDPEITGRLRAKLFLRNGFGSAGALFRSVGPAIGGQFSNNPKDWGRTPEGFGRRVGLTFTIATTRDLVAHTSAAVLGRDPRYQRCDCKGPARRIGQAFKGLLASADSTGALRFDPSGVIGAYAGGYVGANLYPDRFSRRVKGYQLGTQQLGSIVIGNLFLEFGPEIRRIFKRK